MNTQTFEKPTTAAVTAPFHSNPNLIDPQHLTVNTVADHQYYNQSPLQSEPQLIDNYCDKNINKWFCLDVDEVITEVERNKGHAERVETGIDKM